MISSCQQIGSRPPTELIQLWRPLQKVAFEDRQGRGLGWQVHLNLQLGQDCLENFPLLLKPLHQKMQVYFVATKQRLKQQPHQGSQ